MGQLHDYIPPSEVKCSWPVWISSGDPNIHILEYKIAHYSCKEYNALQMLIPERLGGRIFHREFYEAPKEVQELLLMAQGKRRWEGIDKQLPRDTQRVENQLHAIEELGNTQNEFVLRTLSKWYSHEEYDSESIVGGAVQGSDTYLDVVFYRRYSFPHMPGRLRNELEFFIRTGKSEGAAPQELYPHESFPITQAALDEHQAKRPHRIIRHAISRLQESLSIPPNS